MPFSLCQSHSQTYTHPDVPIKWGPHSQTSLSVVYKKLTNTKAKEMSRKRILKVAASLVCECVHSAEYTSL